MLRSIRSGVRCSGKFYAGLGRKDDAVREGKRALELLPESLDAVDGPTAGDDLAEIYALLGDADGGMSVARSFTRHAEWDDGSKLKLEPTWDTLRSDPRFQHLLTKHGES